MIIAQFMLMKKKILAVLYIYYYTFVYFHFCSSMTLQVMEVAIECTENKHIKNVCQHTDASRL